MADKLLFWAPEFFSISPKKIRIESEPNVGRTYFISGDRIIAVAVPAQGESREDQRDRG